jgi:hypothetical protein
MKRTMVLIATLFLLGCREEAPDGPRVTGRELLHGTVVSAMCYWYADSYAVRLDDGEVVQAHANAVPCFGSAIGLDATVEREVYSDSSKSYAVKKLEQKDGGKP